MNLYTLHSDPEQLIGYKESTEKIPGEQEISYIPFYAHKYKIFLGSL